LRSDYRAFYLGDLLRINLGNAKEGCDEVTVA
jgi:hypothetical protein